jgi:LysM repeat protein
MNPKNLYNFNPFEPVSDHITITARSFDTRSLTLKNEYGAVGDKVRSRTKAWTKVRKGDSLGAIARRTGVSVAKLKKLNGMKSSTIIRPGRKIRIH